MLALPTRIAEERAIKSLIATVALLPLLIAAAAEAAILTVTSTADSGGACPGPACTLRQALSTAAPGDRINFSLPAKSEISLTSGPLIISRPLTIDGPGADVLAVVRAGSAPDFAVFGIGGPDPITPTFVSISGLTIANGRNAVAGATGGGIRNAASLTLINCVVSGNYSAGGGGGIGHVSNVASLTLIGTTVSSNATLGSGGGIDFGGVGTLTITNSTFSANAAGSQGGAIANAIGESILTGSTITGNSAATGGGLFAGQGSLNSATSTIFARNTGGDVSGTLASPSHNLIGNAAGVVFSGNPVGNQVNVDPLLDTLKNNGGPTPTHALLAGSPAIDTGRSGTTSTDQRGRPRLVDHPLVSNSSGDGTDIGAYEVQVDAIPSCSAINRVVKNGGDSGIDSLRDVIAKVCPGSQITFAPNVTLVSLSSELVIGKPLQILGPGARSLRIERSAAAGASRIFNVTATSVFVTLSGMTVANGNGAGFGGGIHNSQATLDVADSLIAGNSAIFGGGGIRNDGGTLNVTNTTISGNTVNTGAAGVLNTGKVRMVNSTVSGNVASGGNGGGFVNAGTLDILNSTIARNSATGAGGGLHVNSGSVTITSTILALNTAPSGPDINGTFSSGGYNVVGSASGAVFAGGARPSDQVGITEAQLNLGPLQDNGGPTPTHALLAGSVAIDKGSGDAAAYRDQRGFRRPVNVAGIADARDGSDVGAFEFLGATIDIDANGSYDARTDGLLIIRYLFGLTGNSLTTGALGASATRTAPADLLSFLAGVRSALDVDGNSQADALTDGLLVLRYLFGLRGPSLFTGAIGTGATRSGPQIESYLASLMP